MYAPAGAGFASSSFAKINLSFILVGFRMGKEHIGPVNYTLCSHDRVGGDKSEMEKEAPGL